MGRGVDLAYTLLVIPAESLEQKPGNASSNGSLLRYFGAGGRLAGWQSNRGPGLEGVIGHVALTLTGEHLGLEPAVARWARQLASETTFPSPAAAGSETTLVEFLTGDDAMISAFVELVDGEHPTLFGITRDGIVIGGVALHLAQALSNGLRQKILRLISFDREEATSITGSPVSVERPPAMPSGDGN